MSVPLPRPGPPPNRPVPGPPTATAGNQAGPAGTPGNQAGPAGTPSNQAGTAGNPAGPPTGHPAAAAGDPAGPAGTPSNQAGMGQDSAATVAALQDSVADLDQVDDLPVADHVARYDALHGTLSEALAAIDGV